MESLESDGLEKNALFGGRIVCWQYRNGYRFSIDSVLLAHFPTIRNNETILDLGCGSGIISLILGYRNAQLNINITALEKQEALIELARTNFEENNLSDHVSLIAADVRDIRSVLPAETFSLVIVNPPFYADGSGRLSSNGQAREARHQKETSLQDFIEASAFSVKNRGRSVYIYPADLTVELIHTMKTKGLEPKRCQFVYSHQQTAAPAKLVLIEAVKNGGQGMTVLPPCAIYTKKNGPYTSAVQAMYEA